MIRVLAISRDRLETVLNELKEKGCIIRQVIPDGDLQFTVIFEEPQVLNEVKPT